MRAPYFLKGVDMFFWLRELKDLGPEGIPHGLWVSRVLPDIGA